ncbi:hypothetical protein BCI9360_01718 [Bacillus sp. CECT 9360]|nr:hypothetical protein BCI9360_01718 [Bacillus sp. CECT 9360]
MFHLAILCKDLDETQEFYEKLGCTMARRYDDRVTFNFYGDQVVCHLNPKSIDEQPKIYPRHYGITFLDKEEFNTLLQKAEEQNLSFFQKLWSASKEDEKNISLFF